MILVYKLELDPLQNISSIPCRIYYRKDGDCSVIVKYKPDLSNYLDFNLLNNGWFYLYVLGDNKVTESGTNKEIYFSDLVKI